MKPATYDIQIKSGGAYNPSAFVVSDSVGVMNLTGYTVTAQIRETCDNEVIVADFQVTVTPLEGKIKLYLSDEVTGAITTTGKTFKERSVFWWDLLLTSPSGDAFYLLEGAVYVEPRVTR